MTKEEYENELKVLLERKTANTKEARELDGELLTLRNKFLFPTFDDVENEAKPKPEPQSEQGSVKRD